MALPAPKNFSSTTFYPTLGIDTTLPQYRPCANSTSAPILPQQDQYPVYYFFYGTLANSAFLQERLGLDVEPILLPAVITGGNLRLWKGKYKALVDGGENSKVEGMAYRLESKEQEDALRMFETDVYMVVRCDIKMEGSAVSVKGCTFGIVGTVDD